MATDTRITATGSASKMSLKEAITDLSIQLEVKLLCRKDYQANALSLGIAALKLVQELQKLPGRREFFKLPGETEE